MKKMIKATILGTKNLPGFGSHPGNPILIVTIIYGGLMNFDKGILMMLLGSLIMTVVIGSIYLVGAYGRGRDYMYRIGEWKDNE